MNLRGKLPVEPLDEDRLVRIERRVVAGYGDAMARGQRTGARWVVPALAGAAVAAALAAALVWKLRPAREVTGPAIAAAPMRFEAAATGARVDLGDATLDVTPGAAFVVTRPTCDHDPAWARAVEACPTGTSGVLVALDGGRVEFAVESRKGRAPLVVRAGDVDVVVVGTHFSVERGEAVTVAVTEGVVRVSRGGAEVRVAAGQQWSAPTQVAAGAPMPQPTATAVATADPTGTGDGRDAAGETIASGRIETTTSGVAPELHGHDTVVPPTGAERDRHGGSDHAGASAHGDRDGAGSGSATGARPESKQAALRRMAVAPPKDVGATGEDALKLYIGMAGETGETRRQGFYGAAYTNRALGRPVEALRMLDALKDSKGAELDDVLWLRIQILCRTQVDSKCREAAHQYVQRFTGNDRAELANRITNEID